MKSRWLINLVLITAVAALALVAWYEPGIETASEPEPVSSLDPDQVHRVRIERAARDDLVLNRSDDDGWVIEHRPPLPADDAQVAALTRLAAQEAVRSYPAAELELGSLALKPPQATVTLNHARFDFGNTEPLEGLRYLSTGDRVHLVPDLYQHLVDADFSLFVRRRLLPDPAVITALSLPGLSLAKSGHEWTVEPEQEVGADELQRLVDNWAHATALGITPADPGAEGEPVTLTLKDPAQPVRFLISARKPELVLIRPDLGLEYHMGDAGDLLALPEPTAQAPQ
jgi:hypothetical protein